MKKCILEAYMESFPQVQVYESSVFRARYVKIQGQKPLVWSVFKSPSTLG